MPRGLVKTKADERYWKECKASVPENAKNRWRRVMGCFIKMKANAAKGASWSKDRRIAPRKR